MKYSVDFAFMTAEKGDNFTWTLQMLFKLLKPKSDIPKEVVTDKDTTLMNFVATVLPTSSGILCYFHVGKNVRTKCITYCRVKSKVVKVDGKEKLVNEVKPNEIFDTIFRAWEKVFECPTQDSYASNLMQLRNVCKKKSKDY